MAASRARRVRLTGDFVTGQFFFDSRSAPPFGLEQRLTPTRLDDPWGAAGRTIPIPFHSVAMTTRTRRPLLALHLDAHDIKTTRNHAWNVGFSAR